MLKYLLWDGRMYGNICNTHLVYDIDELKTKIWQRLGTRCHNDAMDEWHKRLWACVHAKVGHVHSIECDLRVFRSKSMIL